METIIISPNGDPITLVISARGPVVEVVKGISVSFDSSAVYTIHSANHEVIAAPGVGKYIKVISVIHTLIHNGITYVTNGGSPQMQLYYGDDRTLSTSFSTVGAFMSSSVSFMSYVVGGTNSFTISGMENKAITARTTSDSQFWTEGNGTYKIKVSYMIVDI